MHAMSKMQLAILAAFVIHAVRGNGSESHKLSAAGRPALHQNVSFKFNLSACGASVDTLLNRSRIPKRSVNQTTARVRRALMRGSTPYDRVVATVTWGRTMYTDLLQRYLTMELAGWKRAMCPCVRVINAHI